MHPCRLTLAQMCSFSFFSFSVTDAYRVGNPSMELTAETKLFRCQRCQNLLFGLACYVHHVKQCGSRSHPRILHAMPWLSKDGKRMLGPSQPFARQWIDCHACAKQTQLSMSFQRRLPAFLKWIKLFCNIVEASRIRSLAMRCCKAPWLHDEALATVTLFLLGP